MQWSTRVLDNGRVSTQESSASHALHHFNKQETPFPKTNAEHKSGLVALPRSGSFKMDSVAFQACLGEEKRSPFT